MFLIEKLNAMCSELCQVRRILDQPNQKTNIASQAVPYTEKCALAITTKSLKEYRKLLMR